MYYRIGIAAHHKRADQAHDLFDTVGAVMMSMDNGTLGCGTNHNKCWTWLSQHPGNAKYLVVLEDDAQPVDGFNQQLEQALAASKAKIVSLYLGDPDYWSCQQRSLTGRLQLAGERADEQNASFITTQELLHGVGIAIKTELVPSMLDYTALSDRPYDYAIRNWARHNNFPIAFTWPSICDHLDLPTLVKHPDGHQRGERKAWRTGTREHWTREAVTL